MSNILDSLAVCLGAVSALRAALCAEEGLRSHAFTAVRHLPWQSHALSLFAGLATVIYALVGGSRDVLVASVLIVCAGTCVPLLGGSTQGVPR